MECFAFTPTMIKTHVCMKIQDPLVRRRACAFLTIRSIRRCSMKHSRTLASNTRRWTAWPHCAHLSPPAIGHLPQIGRKTSETPHRLGVAIRADGHPMFAAAHIDPGRNRVYDFQGLPVLPLRNRPLLFACWLLLVHDSPISIRGSSSARFRFVNRKLSNGSGSQPKTATYRQTNARDRMKTGATLRCR